MRNRLTLVALVAGIVVAGLAVLNAADGAAGLEPFDVETAGHSWSG
jgi:hypothetical protein